MDITKIFGAVLTIAGVAIMLLACYTIMQGGGMLFGTEVTVIGAFVPFILGGIFMGSGIKLLRSA